MSVDRDDVLEGARNLARNAQVAGKRVLVHAEPETSPLLVESIWQALREQGAHAAVLTTEWWHKIRDEPPDVLLQAMKGADVVVSTGEFFRSIENLWIRKAVYDDGIFYVHNEASTPEALGSLYGRFPIEVLAAIGMHVLDQIAGRTIHITTAAGTDLRIGVRPETVGGYWYPYEHDFPGTKKAFPGGAFAFYPEDPVDGVLALEAIPPQLGPPKVHLDEPLRITFRDHRAVGLEGDCADWLRERWRERGDENAGWLGKCMWGIHPKAQSPDCRGGSNPNILNFGMGNSTQYGGPVYSKSWVRGYLERATVVAGDELVLDDGHLCALEAEPVRRAARELGHGPELLEQVEEHLAGLSDLA